MFCVILNRPIPIFGKRFMFHSYAPCFVQSMFQYLVGKTTLDRQLTVYIIKSKKHGLREQCLKMSLSNTRTMLAIYRQLLARLLFWDA